jgi:hypothetical protein
LDWFSTSRELQKAARDKIREVLAKSGEFEIASEQDGMLYTRLFGSDIRFFYQRYPLLEPTVDYQDVRLASPTDIGLMKLAAINSRGTRRDFVDLYCLRETVKLDRLLELVSVKYPDRQTSSL